MYIGCTRFTNQTWQENLDYRAKHNESLIYGSSVRIRDSYNKGSLIFVAEMNNTTNKIEGIGLIRNSIIPDTHNIYRNYEYNRYIYKGNYWLSREQLITFDMDIVEILDIILFKGKSNLKRFLGITILTKKLFTNWAFDLDELTNKIKTAFLQHFSKLNLNINKQVEENNNFDLLVDNI